MPYTPMMLQYFEVKDKYKDYILFYRLGDFYEMFFEDAVTASRELELMLTGRDCGMDERAPMCGVPYHSADGYISKLVKKGYRVAICEQMEDPATAKGIVKREVIRIITPGTVTEGNLLVEGKNNYLASVFARDGSIGFAVADISTADIYVTEFSGEDAMKNLLNETGLYAPSEILVRLSENDAKEYCGFAKTRIGAMTILDAESLSDGECREMLFRQFGNYTESFGVPSDSPSVNALGDLIKYISDTQKTDISYITRLNYYSNEQFLQIDINSRRSLELCENMRTGEKAGSLLCVLDKTKTAMGARLLRKWVEQPLVSCNLIEKRQQAIGELIDGSDVADEIAEHLSKVGDLERILTKIVYNTANARDMKALEHTLASIAPVKKLVSSFSSRNLANIHDGIDELTDIRELIAGAIVDDPPFSVREGGMIKNGVNDTLDELRLMTGDGKNWIGKMEQSERELTGIKNLKVGYNKVFGYYIEVTNSYKDLVPERYIRKQTLVGGERYITEELKEMESKVLSAEDKAVKLEYEIFQKIREKIAENTGRIQKTATSVASLDASLSLSVVARKNSYVCPLVDYCDEIEIKDGRHPVVEQFLPKGMFVPNDTELSRKNRLMLITGPNMAGKSTYMRQNALIVIMAQIGSYVPAKSARIGIVDKIFTRVGASDDLASGQSTFMLEMNEVAYILKHATQKSFIIYDEIGRGTSTFDGMSIARAVAEYTAGKKCGAKSMFATHYHELTELENTCDGVKNYNITAKKRGDELIFLRKIVKGAADDSYGIEVAKLAGVPENVVSRAKEVLFDLESGKEIKPATKVKKDERDSLAITFDDMANNEAIDKLKKLDVDTMTPIEALTKLYELKKLLDE